MTALAVVGIGALLAVVGWIGLFFADTPGGAAAGGLVIVGGVVVAVIGLVLLLAPLISQFSH